MANNFKVWVDSPGSVIMNAEDFASDSQRTGGFVAGTAASALRVNSALRQANLVIAALMGLVDDSNLDLKSNVSDVQNGINTWLTTKITNTTVVNATNALKSVRNTSDDTYVGLTLENNVLKIDGTYIIPYKVLVQTWSSNRPTVPSGSSTTELTFNNLQAGKVYEFRMISGTHVFYQKMLLGSGAAQSFCYDGKSWNAYWDNSAKKFTINQVNGTALTFETVWQIFE